MAKDVMTTNGSRIPIWLKRSRRIGVAIGADQVHVASLDNGKSRRDSFAPWSVRLRPGLMDAQNDPEEAIRAALASCPHLSKVEPALLYVSLLPPLAIARGIELPRLGAEDYRRVLTRDVSRYFPVGHDPQVVGAAPAGRQRSSPAPVFAAAAPARIVEAIERAVEAVGCELASIESAYSSWTEAARRTWPSFSRSDAALIIYHDEVIEVIHCAAGKPVSLRRVSVTAPRERALDAAGVYSKSGPPRVCAMLGFREKQTLLLSGLSEGGVAVLPPTPGTASDAAALSAKFASSTDGPGLYPERIYEHARANSRRLTRIFAGAAALSLVLAAGLFLWGAKRDLGATVDQRAALRSEVTKAIDLRSDIASLESRSARVASLRANTPRWSTVLASIAEELPRDARLTRFQSQADTVVLQGVASRAASVFEALRGIPDITAIRASAPVRQELQDGSPVEHFTVAARVAPLAAPTQGPE
ncbi:MAG TPA: PilN domain-containing protein [Gemmatimonadaceae bacterium]|nr:PilN domain-containing protein [Gemmatimonadaceae bacterium]